MKLCIAGSRPPKNPFEEARWQAKVWHAMQKHMPFLEPHVTEVVSGKARGADQLGEQWAFSKGVPIKDFKPDWVNHPHDAPFLRNIDMANYADAAVIFWDGKSTGSTHMREQMEKRGKPCFVVLVEKEEHTHGLQAHA